MDLIVITLATQNLIVRIWKMKMRPAIVPLMRAVTDSGRITEHQLMCSSKLAIDENN